MTHDSAVTAVAEALCWPAHPGYKPGGCEPCRERAYIAVSAARPIIEAEVRERCGPDHVLGQPCHHLYGRCFPTDAELLEYRLRQREHGARKERERLAAAIHDFFDEPEGTTSHSPDWYVAAEIAEDIAQGNV